jgi:hypothetical protein
MYDDVLGAQGIQSNQTGSGTGGARWICRTQRLRKRILRYAFIHREGSGKIEGFMRTDSGGKLIKPKNPCYIKLANS